MKVALAQLNFQVGNIKKNSQRIIQTIEQYNNKVDLLLFPELAISSYPPEDLLFHQQFIDDCYQAIKTIADYCKETAVIVGFPRFHANEPDKLHNSAALLQSGQIKIIYDKQKLPNYLVFDEMRYFTPGNHDGVANLDIHGKNIKIGLSICEDIWNEAEPVVNQANMDVDLLVNISASPYAIGKIQKRINMLQNHASSFKTPLFYCNLVGGQDELIFDGTSVAINAEGQLIGQCISFEEQILIVDLVTQPSSPITFLEPLAELYHSLIMCTRDYFNKNGFKKAVLGLSGGIDSALTATIACDAIGPANVTGLLMPSKYSSIHSIEDAKALANNLGMPYQLLPIEPIHLAFEKDLIPIFDDYHQNQTDENLQARIRGVINMAFANNQNAILLCTGNKSETAVGYTTLYGDMAGGFAVIKDLFKMQVYALCQYRNTIGHIIPENTLSKPPSAELKPGQKDSDSLPDYVILDEILEAYLHHHKDPNQITQLGHDINLVKKIIQLVDRNEYKRQQAPPGPRVTQMAFGKDRRMPITNGYQH